MSALVNISRVVPWMRKVGVPKRNLAGYNKNYVTPAPPRTRISFTEKITHGLLLSVGIMTYPLSVMGDLRDAKVAKWAKEAEEY